jgi:two-component system sensor histidine kinase QseC
MTRSLKNDLTIPVIVAFLVLGAATFWIVESQIRERLVAEFDQSLRTRATLLMSLTAFEEADLEEDEPEPFTEFDFESQIMPDFAAAQDPAYFQLWMAEEEFARSESLNEVDLARLEVIGDQASFQDAVLPDGRMGRIVTLNFLPFLDEEWGEKPTDRLAAVDDRYPGLTVPVMTLSVAVSREDLDATIGFIDLVLGSGMAILMLVVGGVVRFTVTRGLSPLNRLVGHLDEINSEKLSARLPQDDLPVEVEPLATTMNELLGRLELSFQKERQFSRNIAHELRTPIAELRSIGEVGEMYPDDPDANQQFFGDIRQIGNRMDLMVTNLLTMARQESGQIECAWENLNLTQTLNGVKSRLKGECQQNGIEVSMHSNDSMMVMADRVYLDIIATNLLSNAIHHGGGDVDVRVHSDGSGVGFTIENPTDRLKDDDLPFLFDRFWRKDTVRASGRHAGLGLSLVKSLSEVCRWSVQAEITPSQRFRIRVDGIRHS